jgi:hypothetical protein
MQLALTTVRFWEQSGHDDCTAKHPLTTQSGHDRRKIEIEFTRRSREFNYCLVLKGRQIAKT